MTDSSYTRDLPYPDRLTEDGADLIHEKTLTILSEMGMKVEHDEGRRLLAEKGCDVDDSNIVTFPPDLVEESVDRAPASFTIRERSGEAREVGGSDSLMATVGGPPNVLRYDEGRRTSQLTDAVDFIKLAHMEDVIDVVTGGACEPNDVPQQVKHLTTMEETLLGTDKIPIGSNWGADRARANLDMVGMAHDDPDLREPYVLTIANSVSPRTWDTKMVGGLLEYAESGQPVVMAPAVMAAASGPATLAGSMALANAEILAGITIAQARNPGTPVLYGLPSSNVDVRYGSFAIGSPEGALFVAFAGQMGRYYGVPTRAGGGLTDTKAVDEQAGTEATLQMLATMQTGIDFVLHAAGILDSYSTASLEKFVLDCDRIRYLRKYADGFDVDEDSFALDLIEEVDPGSHFLNKRHTLQHSKEFIRPEIYYRDSYDNWTEEGGLDANDRAHERVERLLDEYERPGMDPDVERDIERYAESERERILEG